MIRNVGQLNIPLPQEKVDQYMIDLIGFTRQKEAYMVCIRPSMYVQGKQA